METVKKIIKLIYNAKSFWLVPGIVTIILFIIIYYFLANAGVVPFGYKIF